MRGKRRPLAVVIGAIAAGLTGGSPAHGAAPAVGPTPLGFVDGTTCPRAEEVSRLADEQAFATALRNAKGGPEARSFAGTMGLYAGVSSPSAAVAVCDPAAAGSGAPVGHFGGNLLGRSGRDAVNSGLRALVAPPGEDGSSLTVGDRIALPELGAAATLDVAVHLGAGVAHARIGPFPSAPVLLVLEPHPQGALLRIDLRDGAAIRQVVQAPRLVRPTLRVQGRGARLVVRGRAQPGSMIAIDHPRGDGRDEVFLTGFDAVGAAAANGRFAVRTARLAVGQRLATIDSVSLSTGSGASWRCRLRWRGERIAATRCGAARAQHAHLVTAIGDTRAVQARPAPRPLGAGRRAARQAGAAARVTTIGRVPSAATPELSGDVSIADATGDGRPELVTAGYAGDHALWASTTAGWQAVRLREDPLTDPVALVDDVTGDGRGEVWTTQGRAIAGDARWSTTARPTLDLRSSVSLGAGDLEVPSQPAAYEPNPPVPLPDVSGDGRPELLFGTAIYASSAFPLGRRTALATAWTAGAAASIAAIGDATSGTLDAPRPGPLDRAVLSAHGVTPLVVATTLRQTDAGWATDLEVRPIEARAPGRGAVRWTRSLPGIAAVVGGQAATGDVLIRQTAACQRRSCPTFLVRFDAAGRQVGGALRLVEDAEPLVSVLVADGSDEDDRAEVLLRTGWSDQLRLWRSSDATANLADLPIVRRSGVPLRLAEPIVGWGAGGRPGGAVVFERVGRGDEVRALWLEVG